jgi:hypothetical protein
MTATSTRYTPAVTLKVQTDMPVSVDGETADKPKPTPSAMSARLTAAAVTAPAAILPQDTADAISAELASPVRRPDSINFSPQNSFIRQGNGLIPDAAFREARSLPSRINTTKSYTHVSAYA